jgi:hypothetical protein
MERNQLISLLKSATEVQLKYFREMTQHVPNQFKISFLAAHFANDLLVPRGTSKKANTTAAVGATEIAKCL